MQQESQTPIPLDQVIAIIQSGLVQSASSFEASANGRTPTPGWGADRMPESWIAACIMRVAHENQLAAVPEVRINPNPDNDDIHWFTTGQGEQERRLTPQDFPNLMVGHARHARIDLVIADVSAIPECMRVRAAMEIKGPKANWAVFPPDLARCQELRTVINDDDQAVLFVYVTCPLTPAEHAAGLVTMCNRLGLQPQDVTVIPALRDSIYQGRRSYVYIHVLP